MLTKGLYFCVKLALLQLYPAYICYKAIKADNQTEYASLLKFWVVSISYLSVEYFSDIFLFWFVNIYLLVIQFINRINTLRIPFYTEVKLIIALWLILPQTKVSYLWLVFNCVLIKSPQPSGSFCILHRLFRSLLKCTWKANRYYTFRDTSQTEGVSRLLWQTSNWWPKETGFRQCLQGKKG
jgi:hypothetical protein